MAIKKIKVNSDEVAVVIERILDELEEKHKYYCSTLKDSEWKKYVRILERIFNKLADILFIKPYMGYRELNLTELEMEFLISFFENDSIINKLIHGIRLGKDYSRLGYHEKAFVYFYTELFRSLNRYKEIDFIPNIIECREEYIKNYINKTLFIYEKVDEEHIYSPLVYFVVPDRTNTYLENKYIFSRYRMHYYKSKKDFQQAYELVEIYKENPPERFTTLNKYGYYSTSEYDFLIDEIEEAEELLHCQYGPGWRCDVYIYNDIYIPGSRYYDKTEIEYVEEYLNELGHSKCEIKVFDKTKYQYLDSELDAIRMKVLNGLTWLEKIAYLN